MKSSFSLPFVYPRTTKNVDSHKYRQRSFLYCQKCLFSKFSSCKLWYSLLLKLMWFNNKWSYILVKFADGNHCWLCLFMKSTTECFMAIIRDGQLLLETRPNSFSSNCSWLPASHFSTIIDIFFTSCHAVVNHLYHTVQLPTFSAIADCLPGRQFLYIDRNTMKHNSSQWRLLSVLNRTSEAQSA